MNDITFIKFFKTQEIGAVNVYNAMFVDYPSRDTEILEQLFKRLSKTYYRTEFKQFFTIAEISIKNQRFYLYLWSIPGWGEDQYSLVFPNNKSIVYFDTYKHRLSKDPEILQILEDLPDSIEFFLKMRLPFYPRKYDKKRTTRKKN